jgi:hypothetical protein
MTKQKQKMTSKMADYEQTLFFHQTIRSTVFLLCSFPCYLLINHILRIILLPLSFLLRDFLTPAAPLHPESEVIIIIDDNY